MNNPSLRKKDNILVGSLVSLISYLCIALMAAAVKLVPHTVNIGTIIFFQYLITFLLTLPNVFIEGIGSLKTTQFRAHFIRDIAGILTFTFFFLSLATISIVNAIVLRSTTPFWIPLILFFWRGDRIRLSLWAAIAVGFIGIILIVKPGASGYLNIGTIFALLSGFVMAISALTIRRMSASEPAQRTLFYYGLIATVVSLPFAFLHRTSMSWQVWVLLISIGVLMYIVQYTLIIAFRYAKASRLAPMSYTAIVFSGLLDWFIWHKAPDLLEYLGIILVIGAGIISILIERKYEKTNETPIKR